MIDTPVVFKSFDEWFETCFLGMVDAPTEELLRLAYDGGVVNERYACAKALTHRPAARLTILKRFSGK